MEEEEAMTTIAADPFVPSAALAELRAAGSLVVHVDGHTVCLIADGDAVHAVDNRCPHMGFPLHRGTVADGILTCHWHHARFDLCSGGTFDQWADDLRRFPVEVRGEQVYVDLRPLGDATAHQRHRLRVGLERNISLVLAKATIALMAAQQPNGIDAFRAGLTFGVERRGEGWGRGLTTLVCLMQLAPRLDGGERAAALYHGLAEVAAESAGEPPRFPLDPLPTAGVEPQRLARWFRRFIEVRDSEGAERALVSAVRADASPEQLADMLYAACTDHRYLTGGHVLDFTTKALEALDVAGWQHAEAVLAALPALLADAQRMEESNAWRNPVDLVALLEAAFERLENMAAPAVPGGWDGRADLIETVLGDDPAATFEALLAALAGGATAVELASAVTFAAATRIARFPTSNEFGDWDTAMHTFTFANAVDQGLRRSPSPELVRGVFDAAASVYLDRFLNVPATRLPEPAPITDPDALLAELPQLLDQQQQVNEAAQLVVSFLAAGGHGDRLVAALGAALLREDRNFHTIQCLEAATRQHQLLSGSDDATMPLIAAARYLAAHATTTRAQRQTFEIARRLHHGEKLYEDATR
jgi:nitrite reductase/ring-hydroxylating ferredoxin subunit